MDLTLKGSEGTLDVSRPTTKSPSDTALSLAISKARSQLPTAHSYPID